MKKINKSAVFLLFLVQFCFAQQIPRELIRGEIVADSLGVGNVNITNISSGKVVLSDDKGEFFIHAREKDTLLFTSQTFDSKRVVVGKGDFLVKVIRVKLQQYVNPLDEVKVGMHSLTGNLEKDEKNFKAMQQPEIKANLSPIAIYTADTQTSPTNTLMPGYVDSRFMMDFMKIGGKLVKLIKGDPKPKKIIFTSDEIFPVAARQRLPEGFFLETLQLKKDDIGLFLSFCENDARAKSLLEVKKELELITFLLEKKKEYDLAVQK
ncbi:hypothetical protein [Flavobacterium sp. 3HN19-14]|uniref:hypothetical protein n=1 Tax=Flavobacterium sp. 3HN19-14 TaxID=3448133 RepID=UPI003EDE8E25